MTIYYSGAINEDACYPEVDKTVRESNFRLILYNIDKRYSFLTPDYVLLTPENLWYPVAGIPYGSAYPQLQAKDFVDFTLRVKTGHALTAVSQGAVTRGGDGVFIFRPEVPLPQLSLAIGRYEKRTMTVEEVDYNLFILEGHDYFSEYFTELNEKLPELISDIKMRYEDRLGIGYPYKRFSLIETPVQFFTYPRLWTLVQETVQPEQVYLPEKGMLLLNADFRQRSYRIERMSQRGQRTMTPEEIEGNWTRFLGLLEKLGDRTAPVMALIGELDERICLAPASRRTAYHSCFPGGLVEHSLRVLGNAFRLCKTFGWQISRDSLILVCLMHDLGKVAVAGPYDAEDKGEPDAVGDEERKAGEADEGVEADAEPEDHKDGDNNN